MARTILAIDPGTKNTGWAKFYQGKLLGSGVFRTKRMVAQSLKVRDQVDKVASLILELPTPTELWVEAFFPRGKFRPKAGNYQLMLNGALLNTPDLLRRGGAKKVKTESFSVQASQWKGWLKDQVQPQPLVEGIKNPHEKDAILIGLFALEKGEGL